MKDETNPIVADAIGESVVVDEKLNHRKTVRDSEDTRSNSNGNSNSDSDNDSGFLNASNSSLNLSLARDECPHKGSVEESEPIEKSENPETPTWKSESTPETENDIGEYLRQGLIMIANELKEIPEEKKRKWALDRITEYYGDKLPMNLVKILSAFFFDGDCGYSMDVKPEWFDSEKFLRGQKFARDNMFSLAYADLLGLYAVFSFELGLKFLIVTDASSTPYTAYKRYLSTGSRILNWYTSDPWTPGTPAYKDMMAVRRKHALVRKNVNAMSQEEFDDKTKIKNPWCPSLETVRRDCESTCPAPKLGQCPYLYMDKFPKEMRKEISQCDMCCTQFAFVGLLILDPPFFGVHNASDEDLEGFCHLWKSIGYQLGIEDEFNFCTGTVEEIKSRTRNILEYWVKPNYRTLHPEWEHMLRCMIEGLQYYFPGTCFESSLIDFARLLNMHVPRFSEILPYGKWIKNNIMRFYFNYASRFSPVRLTMNQILIDVTEKAKQHDAEKHKEIQNRSESILNAYRLKTQNIKKSLEDCSTE